MEAEVVLGSRNPRVVFFPVAEVVIRATVCCYNRNTKVLQNLLPRDGSRGITIQHVKPGCRWWSGPSFLWQPEHQWPIAQVEDIRSDDKEIRRPATVMLTTDTSQVDIILQRYSSWSCF